MPVPEPRSSPEVPEIQRPEMPDRGVPDPSLTGRRSAGPRLAEVLAPVAVELARMNSELASDLRPGHEDLEPLVARMAAYRGKQLRAAILFLAAKAVGAKVIDTGHYVSAKVVELIHLATLVHDDVLDAAELRRQVPTINTLHGNEVPVLLGDYVFAAAFEMSLQLSDLTCARLLAGVTRTICQGEIRQSLHRFDETWDEDRYYRVVHDKTASLYSAAASLGAHYSHAQSDWTQALSNYGSHLGVAFQIADDCLDLAGDPDVVGKSLGSDLAMGKLTLPLLHLSLNGDGPRFRCLLAEGRHELAQHDVAARLAREFDLPGAVSFALDRARYWADRAVAELEILPAGPAVAALAAVAQFVLSRRR